MNIVNEMSKVKDDFSGCACYWVAYQSYITKSKKRRKILIHSASPGIDVILEDSVSLNEIATIRLNKHDNDNVKLEDSTNRSVAGVYTVFDAVDYIINR